MVCDLGDSGMTWLIIFPDAWLAYSPSILNFVKMLEKYNQSYLVLYLDTGEYDNSHINIKGKPIKIKVNFLFKVLRKLRLHKIFILYSFLREISILKKEYNFDEIVGIDALGFLIGRCAFKQLIYYSLEVQRSLANLFVFKYLHPKCLIIQSEDRVEYLNIFKENNTKNYFIQNSPIIDKNNGFLKKIYQGKLIYFGNIIKSHGVENCIETLYLLKNNETLTLKGTCSDKYFKYLTDKYQDLLKSKRLIIDTSYIEQEKIVDYLSDFNIGFCLYDLDIIGNNDFNYISCPSGKLFNYLMCGIPVIGNDIIGLQVVTQEKTGILIEELSSEKIIKAINDIALEYQILSQNAYNTSFLFDYETMFKAFWKDYYKL